MGGGDGLCATVGAGCVEAHDVYGCIGSSAWIAMTAQKPLYDREQRTFNLAHIVPGLVCPFGTMQAAGNAITWLKNEIATLETDQAARSGKSPYELIQGLLHCPNQVQTGSFSCLTCSANARPGGMPMPRVIHRHPHGYNPGRLDPLRL